MKNLLFVVFKNGIGYTRLNKWWYIKELYELLKNDNRVLWLYVERRFLGIRFYKHEYKAKNK